jgi:hypothetical protein
MAYEHLTGQPPLYDESRLATSMRHINHPIPPVIEIKPTVERSVSGGPGGNEARVAKPLVSPLGRIPAPVPELCAHAGDHAGRQRLVPLDVRVYPGVVLEEPRLGVPRLMLHPAVLVG